MDPLTKLINFKVRVNELRKMVGDLSEDWDGFKTLDASLRQDAVQSAVDAHSSLGDLFRLLDSEQSREERRRMAQPLTVAELAAAKNRVTGIE